MTALTLFLAVPAFAGTEISVLPTALVYFRHDDPASHHALNGVDWADCLERLLDVPHKDDVTLQSFYYVLEGEESPAPAAEDENAGNSLPAPEPSSVVIETKQYSDGSSATGPAPLPDLSPEQQAAQQASAADLIPAPEPDVTTLLDAAPPAPEAAAAEAPASPESPTA